MEELLTVATLVFARTLNLAKVKHPMVLASRRRVYLTLVVDVPIHTK